MRKDTPDPRDSAARTEYQAAIALRGFVDIDKDSIEVGEWKFTAEEALESLHHGVCKGNFDVDPAFRQFRQTFAC